MSELVLSNRQRVRRIDTRLLRRIVRDLLAELFEIESYELGIHLVAAEEMAAINESFLGHKGSTDVITFDYQEEASGTQPLHGELFISVPDAVKQAAEFGTSWQSELVRYIIHGILHLQGHDDLRAQARKRMKGEENRLLRLAATRFYLSKLQKAGTLRKRAKNRR